MDTRQSVLMGIRSSAGIFVSTFLFGMIILIGGKLLSAYLIYNI